MPFTFYISEVKRLLRIGKETIGGISNELTLPNFFRRYDQEQGTLRDALF
jgi:hypothetical protein